jgi:hypothetical protein
MRFFAIIVLALQLFQGVWAQDKEARKLLESGYEALRRSPAEAVPYFEQIVALDSTSVFARRQLGSLYIAVNSPGKALLQFEAAQRLLPSDTTSLQVAYLLNALGRNRESLEVFRGIQESPDSSISAAARSAVVLLELQVCAEQQPWWYRAYVSPYYDTRFKDLVVMGSAYAGRYIDSTRRYSWFGTAALATDTRSTAGALPEIYADHFLLVGGGFRAQPLPGLTADAQLGLTADLLRRPGKPVINPDLRIVASYGNGIYPSFTLKDGPAWPIELLADGYASAGYYTRYANVIGYLQGRAGARMFSYRYTTADLYGRFDLTWDTHGDFYNNTVELSAGLRVIPHQAWGLQVLLEYHLGRYTGSSAGNPFGAQYNSTRLFLILDRFFCW